MRCHLELTQLSQRKRRAEREGWSHICYEAGRVMVLPHGLTCQQCDAREPLRFEQEDLLH